MQKQCGIVLVVAALVITTVAHGQNDEGELAKVKEFELEEVREQISELKASMDRSAAERSRITTDLQESELAIAEKRAELKDIEQQRAFSKKRKESLEASIAERESDLAAETEQLAAQVRSAYTSGGDGRVKLLLNQQDPAAVGRLVEVLRVLC